MTKQNDEYDVTLEAGEKKVERIWLTVQSSSQAIVDSSSSEAGITLTENKKGFLSKSIDAARNYELTEFEVGIPGYLKLKFKRKE